MKTLYNYAHYLILILFLSLSFTGHAQFILNGSSTDLGNGEYQLTPAANGQVGTIWSDQKVSLNNSFEVEFELYFGTKDGNGADGITFSLQPKSNTVGVPGGGLGINGITPSLITEMDTYRNGGYGDPSFDHVALSKNTVDHTGSDNLVSPVQIVNGVSNVEDGAWYNFKASWDASTQVFQVSVNGNSRLFYQGDIINTVFNGDPMVYWGFTASTGGANNLQKVRVINTTLLDLYPCTETPNDQTFCNNSGPVSVNLSVANTQAGTTYEWYDSPSRDNLLQTGTSYSTPPLTESTDYYVLATTTGGTSTATVGPTPTGTLTDIWDASYTAGYDRNFIAHVPVKINSVEVNHPAWQGGCGAVGTSKVAEIDVYTSGGALYDTKLVSADCGVTSTVPLGFDLPAGSYTMKLRGITGGNFRVTNDGSEKSIPGVITLENNSITGPGGSLSYSSVFFNWNIEGGAGTSECMLSVKAEKDCPPCSTYPTVDLGTGFTYCSDSDTTITVTTTATNILWSTGETTNTITVNEGTFTISAWDDETCETYESITISKECPPNLILDDTVIICSGVTSQISASGIQTGFWSGTDAFTQLNDSLIEVNLQSDAEYYITNYTKLNILSDNINFEDPVICSSNCYQIINANTVPGWETTASDNMVEIWSAGFLGVQPYSGNQFMELNANQDAALYQDVATEPGAVMGINLAHRGRNGVDVMELKAGPPGGPYQSIKSYSDGLSWGYYTDYYTVPAGQTTTRFLFETVTCNGGPCGGSGNFLDAIEFFKIKEEYDTVYVKVNPSPIVNLGNDTTICGTINQVLDAGNTGSLYTWNTAAASQTIPVTTGGTYAVSVELNGCFDQDTITITQGAPLTVELGNDTAICEGNSITFDAGNPGSNYTWNTAAGSQTITINTAGEYIVQVSNSDGCIESDSINLTVSPMPVVDLGNDTSICDGNTLILDAGNAGFTFDWNTSESSQTINTSGSGTYSVVVSGGPGCTDEDSITINIFTNPTVNLGNDTSICSGDTITIDPQNTGAKYQWSTAESTQSIMISTAATYSVTVTDVNGCLGYDEIELSVNPLPTVEVTAPNNICLESGVIDINVSPFGGVLTGIGLTGDQFDPKSPDVIQEQPAWIGYTYTDNNGCTSVDSTSITVRAEPNPQQWVSDTFVCKDGQVTIVINEGGSDYVDWYKVDNSYIIGTGNSITINEPGEYYTIGHNTWCSTYSDTIKVDLIEPFVEGSVNPELSIMEGESANINVVNPQADYTYRWENSSTGDIYNSSTAVVTPSETTTYFLTGQIKSCSSTIAIEVVVDPNVTVPNAFSPNGDGSNDEWDVLNLDAYPNAGVHIMNRWGMVVYENFGTFEPWDGFRNGNLLPVATYYYIIELNDHRGRVLTGSVTLVR